MLSTSREQTDELWAQGKSYFFTFYVCVLFVAAGHLCLTLCDLTDFVHGIFWAKILEWFAFPSLVCCHFTDEELRQIVVKWLAQGHTASMWIWTQFFLTPGLVHYLLCHLAAVFMFARWLIWKFFAWFHMYNQYPTACLFKEAGKGREGGRELGNQNLKKGMLKIFYM